LLPSEKGSAHLRQCNYSIKLAKVGVLPSDQGHPHQHLRVPPFEVPTAIEGSKLDLGFSSWILSLRFEALILGFAIEFMSRGFWSATWIWGTYVDLFRESSGFKQKMELI
jgi:hypothetical protein